MANLTVTEAITEIRQELDDVSTTKPRWTDAQVKTKLGFALSACLVQYASDGGDRFDLEGTATTSASTGQVSLSSLSALWVKQVAIVVGNTTYRVRPKNPIRRGYADLNARDLRILYVREYEIPSDSGHPLVGVTSTAANSWPGFDRWVYMEAAVMLTSKDMEEKRIAALIARRDEAKAIALGRVPTPAGYPIPRPEWNPIAPQDLRWQFTQASATLSLTAEW